MFASIAKRVMIYIILAVMLGALFTMWAKGKWDTPTFLAFSIAAFLFLLAPTPNSNSPEEVASSTAQTGEADRKE